jgi:hypothetical protein
MALKNTAHLRKGNGRIDPDQYNEIKKMGNK